MERYKIPPFNSNLNNNTSSNKYNDPHSPINYQLLQDIKKKTKQNLSSLINNQRHNSFNKNDLKVKKSVLLSSPVFSLKYSYFHPNILCACEESGHITIIDTYSDKLLSPTNSNSESNNTLNYHQINPIHKQLIHSNSIFDFEWCFSDNKILTASGDMSSILVNYENLSNVTSELMLVGHSKSIKSVKQSFDDEMIIATCGRDGMIFIWDMRTNNKKFCSKNCESYLIPHIHPVGGFKSINKNSNLLKNRKSSLIGEDSNTFTGISFYNKNLLLSIETNEDDIKFWDMRKMLDSELEYFLNQGERPNQKLTRKQILKIEEKENFIANINQYSHIYLRYLQLQETIKMSSKHNSSKNLLFGNLPSQSSNLKFGMEKMNNKTSYVDKRLDFSIQKITNTSLSSSESANSNDHGIRFINKEDVIKIEKELLISSNDNMDNGNINLFQNDSFININPQFERNFNNDSGYFRNFNDNNNNNHLKFGTKNYEEEEQILKNKIKEIKDKRVVRGLTSIYVNRESRKILVNSMSNTQYIYDSLYWDKYPPIELKGHKSSFCVKSVLSPNGDYVLSGSSDANIYIWNANGSDPHSEATKLTGFHSMEVGAVDWGRNEKNFIASACDNGYVLIWDDK